MAAAVLAETSSEHDHAAIGLGVFAESVEPLAPRAARPALRWLRAKAYERLGDLEQAEATYHAAESLDPSWPLTLMSLARYASDRGDAERGLSSAAPGRGAARSRTGGAARAFPAGAPPGSGPQPTVLVRLGPQVQGVPPAPRAAAAGRAGRLAVPESGGGPARRGPVRPPAHRDRAGAGAVLGLPRRARAGARGRSGLRRGAVRGRRVRRLPCRARLVAARGRAVAGRAVAAGGAFGARGGRPFGAAKA